MPRVPKRQRLNDMAYANGSTLAALSHDKYTVGWICALSIEMSAAVAMLDEIHQGLPRADEDTNTYTLGRIAAHNVAIACLPSGYYGNNNAAAVATNMRRTFPSMRFCLMVGIGGGAPGKADIRLGDVVVSEGVMQYDLGKSLSEGRFTRTGIMNRPPQELLTAVANLRARHRIEASRIPSILSEMLERHPTMSQSVYRNSLQDRLFDSTYDHVQSTDVPTDDCELCDISRLEDRSPRDSANPKIHYGTIASANQVMKQVKTRDKLAHELGVLCFEMEGSGVMDGFAGLVVRGICDYSDSHKNKQWQEVAATVAAAYAKELLLVIPAAVCTAAPVVAIPSVDLGFEQINARRSNIKPKYSTTCRWLLSHPDYLDWQDPKQAVKHHGFLWIRGGPGTGKSTIMNFAYKEAMTHKDVVVISFFFNARGESLERSTQGMYRSLLFQLLSTLPNLVTIFDASEHKKFLDDFYTATLSHHNPVWQIVVLQDLLRSALTKLGQIPLAIFVDALDECSSDQVEELVEYFEALGEDAEQNGLRLNICFSSRYYPYIDIQYGLKIKLEAQGGHEEDIAMYIRNKLRIGTSKTAEEIKTGMQAKAKGIFMWVVLVVDILKAEYRSGRIFDVKKRLAALPAELSDLFKEILARDQKNIGDLKLCIQWILFAKRPLKLEEYYFAAVSALSPDELGEWDQNDITTEDMGRFVISSSKGLAETTKSKVKTVQFIHESVREFFLKNALHELWPNLAAADFESTPTSPQEDDAFARLDYGSNFKVKHDQTPLLWAAARGYAVVVKLLVEKGSDIKAEDKHHRTPLWHAVEHGHDAVARLLLQNGCEIQEFSGQCTPPLIHTIIKGNEAMTRLLLEKGVDIEAKDEVGMTALSHATKRGRETIIQLLLENGANVEASDIYGQSPLFVAISTGNEYAIRLLLKAGAVIEAKDGGGRTPLMYAITTTHEATVRLLLEKGADIEAKDEDGMTSLMHATENWHEAIVWLLLEKGANIEAPGTNINAKDVWGWTALIYAIERQHEAIVRLLLIEGADIEAKDYLGRTPLMHAITRGYEAIVRLLLAEGADIEAKDIMGQTSLMFAVNFGQEHLIRLLHEKGGDITATS
ncbi:hypothetical protein MY4824_000220 [Beauveria thailandica]